MGNPIEPRRHAAAQASGLFVVAGLISVCYDFLPNQLGANRAMSIVLDTLTIALGVVLRLLPWSEWPARALSVLPVLALSYLALDRSLGVIPNETYGIWIILVFVWIGLWQPPRSAIAMVPVAVAMYIVPFAFVGVPEGATLASVAISVPVAAVVGETLSRRAAAVARADADRQLALDALARASVTDDLTGLGNRRQANVMLDQLATGDALAILDLDHFKVVNDTYGHQHGDHVLHEFGQFLAAQLRNGDTVARFGGEEFIMVLRNAGDHGLAIVERLLDEWRACGPATTLSAGLALHDRDSWSDTFMRADAALYTAKHTGRDRVVLAPDVIVRRPMLDTVAVHDAT